MVFVIGLTGGIATGKSTCTQLVVQYLQSQKISVMSIDADKIGHLAYIKGSAAYDSIISTFGPSVVTEGGENDGEINRKALGGIVFSDPAEMKKLTDICWPVIRDHISETIKTASENVVVLEAAILLEACWSDLIDILLIPSVSVGVAKARLMSRNALSEEEAMKRINGQMDNDSRMALAHEVMGTEKVFKIENEGNEEEFQGNANTVMMTIMEANGERMK
jgi:dephospho-CoA kinase